MSRLTISERKNNFRRRQRVSCCVSAPFRGRFVIQQWFDLFYFQSFPAATLELRRTATRSARWLCTEPPPSSPATPVTRWWAPGCASVCPTGSGAERRSSVLVGASLFCFIAASTERRDDGTVTTFLSHWQPGTAAPRTPSWTARSSARITTTEAASSISVTRGFVSSGFRCESASRITAGRDALPSASVSVHKETSRNTFMSFFYHCDYYDYNW